jgi:uncharacterized protein YlxW (UPF0749 family)
MLLNRVQEKRDSDAADREDKGQNPGKDQRQNSDNDRPEKFEVKAADVQSAIETFAKNEQMTESGLTAIAEGSGPGLRVTLKDGQGRFVRQLTGEEFVKLKDGLNDKVHRPGKILDTKF